MSFYVLFSHITQSYLESSALVFWKSPAFQDGPWYTVLQSIQLGLTWHVLEAFMVLTLLPFCLTYICCPWRCSSVWPMFVHYVLTFLSVTYLWPLSLPWPSVSSVYCLDPYIVNMFHLFCPLSLPCQSMSPVVAYVLTLMTPGWPMFVPLSLHCPLFDYVCAPVLTLPHLWLCLYPCPYIAPSLTMFVPLCLHCPLFDNVFGPFPYVFPLFDLCLFPCPYIVPLFDLCLWDCPYIDLCLTCDSAIVLILPAFWPCLCLCPYLAPFWPIFVPLSLHYPFVWHIFVASFLTIPLVWPIFVSFSLRYPFVLTYVYGLVFAPCLWPLSLPCPIFAPYLWPLSLLYPYI